MGVLMLFNYVFLCIAGFFAAAIDSIAGGGGIISLPAFLFCGVPPHMALGTNKFSSSCASFTSSLKYAQSGKVNFKLLKFLAPFTLAGAALGVACALSLKPAYLSIIVLALLLCVGIYSLFSKTVGIEDNFHGLSKKNIILGMALAASLGFYDGFFGPGTGSFLIFGLINIYGFDFINAGGNGKVLNFISNITSLLLFAINGQINYMYGVPVAIFMIAGARVGTKLALSKGAKLMKPIFVVMSLAAAAKMLFSVFK